MNITRFQSWLKAPSHTLIMGILNVTPDSFSDGGKFADRKIARDHALQMIDEGADMIDIGGESSRPGAEPVSMDEELNRTIPVIEAIRQKSDCLISIDTYKPTVAKAALDAGADMVNDISGFTFDNGMAPLVAKRNVPVILMHIKGIPRDMQKDPHYDNLMREIRQFFKNQVASAKAKGVSDEMIILDPGIGFGKRLEDNFEIIRELRQICAMGYPVLLGPSRKSFIGTVLDLPVEERLEGTLASITAGIINGAKMVRVHDVKETRRAVTITEKIMGMI
ncbi:MAG: dihydropteroate synthase [Candidatus Marinimicrobia bacterium]|jgi:dihydropteroate synthase|nr:dihydropteroate synthase [Candidatus Neomarinimicrobiota bacterium]MBT3676211.1 dihydropteroate synthase [Candidatus Neomarinimicrobiota bacterium]MBT3763093.1 dihydropteroate synthase [Candidatus Neomarinimicrobiota bacterium]MBT4067387.1 dihydropteroate synthase [Candidatus Neomarinimicrobiota bacterium]MBT4270879.1 dihydropteroate synthase [Candidatus Neomarinimicrobiota bacterium]